MKQTSTKREIWIGLVEIVPGENCVVLDPDKGAFTSVLTFAVDETEYKEKTTDVMKSYGAIVLGFEHIEPCRVRLLKNQNVPDELKEIADELQPTHTRFATFFTYPFRRS